MAGNGQPAGGHPRLVVFHPLDPRGGKIGGIETHVRLILAHHPPDIAVLLVGVDEVGGAPLGRLLRLRLAGREVDFLAVLRMTLRYALAALRHLLAIRRALGGAPASCEIGRFEFALLPILLRRPLLLVVHNEGRREDAMDSLLKRHWWMHRLSERIALRLATRIFAVNPAIARRIAGLSPRQAAEASAGNEPAGTGPASGIEVLSVSVDTALFRPSPFPRLPLPQGGEVLRVCYAGRLDAFKDPALMFSCLALAADRLAAAPVGRFRRLAFSYAGPSEPAAVPGHASIAPLLEHRGILDAPAVAALMRDSHCGLVTSVFEGLPCYLLEMLASGRPVAAVALPQFDGLIVEGVSGRRVARRPDGMAEAMAEALLALASAVAGDALDPSAMAALVAPFSVEWQMARLFEAHRALATA